MITADEILSAKILVVDDKEANVQLIVRMLGSAGYTSVQSTMIPRDVCDLHRANGYGLILLDLQMPEMDGFEVIEGLKLIEADSYLPVLVITAQPGHKLRALEAGAKDFVSKPFDLAELLARVHNILEVRLLHVESKRHTKDLQETVRELEASREINRLQALEEQKATDREIALAQETQRSLLPRYLPKFENFNIYAYNKPTQALGGNFYEFLQLSAGEFMGVLADVSGKGMASALFSSLVLGALTMEFRSGAEPKDVLQRVNKLLYEKSLPSQFVTLFLFLMTAEGSGRFISAGHLPVYVFRAANGAIEEFESESYMLGMFDFSTYRSRKFQLDKGDILVVYSDGLTKAENADRELFGTERLLEVIREEGLSGGAALEQRLLKDVDAFTQGIAQPDDITYFIVEKYQ